MDDIPHAPLTPAAVHTGKLGLALSGGGFRAALFHVGVLARLAERDLLRHVAVISTVSGGSIIGAYYYLKVKQMLEGRRSDGLRPDAAGYLGLVQEVETGFLEALQKNIRIQTFADHRENARMLDSKSSPTQRVAALLDTHFYAPVAGRSQSLLCNLPIKDSVTGIDGDQPTVPRLILNTTALNTGHLFQFTGSHVGSPGISTVSGGSASMVRMPRLRMDDPSLGSEQRARLHLITLGEAVAASCCVPGLLDPFSLRGLYQDERGREVTLRLVDGGVFDNQGLVSLFEEDCSHFICSDASDILQWQSNPSELFHSVAMRANDILMDRIRVEVMEELLRRDPARHEVFTLGGPNGCGVFQQHAPAYLGALKGLRTDLDAFSDLEADALMYHGYRVSTATMPADSESVAQAAASSQWQFNRIEALADNPREWERLLRHLEVGSRQFFKVFYLGKPLPWVIAVLPTLIPIGLAALLLYLLPPIPAPAWVVLALLLVSAVAFAQNARIIGWLDQIETFRRWRSKLAVALKPLGMTVILGMSGALASWINLRVFCPLFLRYGRADKRA